MRKIYTYLSLLILLLAASCQQEDLATTPALQPGEYRFSVAIPEPIVASRALGDQPQDVANMPMHVLVFDENGFYIATQKATVESFNGTEGTYTVNLPKNDGGVNHIHGGPSGFDGRVWDAEASASPKGAVLKLNLVSPDGDQGYPGTLKVAVTYTLDNSNTLTVNYKATADKPTVCNLTNHSYFNLAGEGRGSVANHEVTINADKFTPVSKKYLIPTGGLKDVEGTPFDFRKPRQVGARIEADDAQLQGARGYDHNWALNKDPKNPKAMTLAARVYEPSSGREMTVYTTEPGVQFYAGNALKGVKGKGGKRYFFRYGMCFETQHYPDSPNNEDFPSTLRRPGETYDTTTAFRFGAY